MAPWRPQAAVAVEMRAMGPGLWVALGRRKAEKTDLPTGPEGSQAPGNFRNTCCSKLQVGGSLAATRNNYTKLGRQQSFRGTKYHIFL